MSRTSTRGGLQLVARWQRMVALGRDAGMATSEYAVGILAAVSFAVVLIGIVKSGAVKGALISIITGALNVAG
ncbi:DUF4244 domain-containing protein [Calidifontibacter sp. DB0510]|uniref:DUF4244 domain-containing protein n=1 Tax=Metallococcus carri TaxID=1656884 RepID=A0A967EA13_9MICO|nr:DUF4244 domain-containing protein [Metallococcus carri]NHN55399.1 DUF4244 domain-containing protein [Metallococcus carri]NOP36476.1 DUF4244 domain-containing protein [Calidifontibacter sp. DB2511S]